MIDLLVGVAPVLLIVVAWLMVRAVVLPRLGVGT